MVSTLKIAACQFPVSRDIVRNASYIKKYMKKAHFAGAQLAHFSECALSGYAGVDFDSFENFDWEQLQIETDSIINLARELELWVILGTTHRAQGKLLLNSQYIISDKGEIADRYDKQILTKNDVQFYAKGKGK